VCVCVCVCACVCACVCVCMCVLLPHSSNCYGRTLATCTHSHKHVKHVTCVPAGQRGRPGQRAERRQHLHHAMDWVARCVWRVLLQGWRRRCAPLQKRRWLAGAAPLVVVDDAPAPKIEGEDAAAEQAGLSVQRSLFPPVFTHAGIWVKPGRERDALTAMLVQEGCIPVWIDPTLVRTHP